MFTSTGGLVFVLVKKRRLNDFINQLPVVAKRETMCRGQVRVNLRTCMPSPRVIHVHLVSVVGVPRQHCVSIDPLSCVSEERSFMFKQSSQRVSHCQCERRRSFKIKTKAYILL